MPALFKSKSFVQTPQTWYHRLAWEVGAPESKVQGGGGLCTGGVRGELLSGGLLVLTPVGIWQGLCTTLF